MTEVTRRTLLKGMGAGAAGIAAWSLVRAGTSIASRREAAGGSRPGGPGGDEDDRCMFGIYAAPRGQQTREQAITDLEAKIGRRFALDRQYYTWNENFPTAYDTWTRDEGRVPLLSWIPRTNGGGFVPWGEIAAGGQDDRIRGAADGCKAFGTPITLSFNHEPENNTNVWGTEAEFIAAWRRIHDIFIERGAVNVSWAWIMTAISFRKMRAERWYPGDDHVDFLAADGYNFFGCRYRVPWVRFEFVFDAFYRFGLDRRKPMLITEWGSIEDPAVPGRKAEWILDAAATLKDWPEVVGETYFNAAPICPWWVDTSPSSLEAFTSMGQDPYFL